jgi:hypothetical protein
MIAFYRQQTDSATWDGTSNYWGNIGSTDTVIYANSWPNRAYDLWRQAEKEAEALRKYEESRAWQPAPVTIRPEFPGISDRHILPRRHISPRPWTGKNFHK